MYKNYKKAQMALFIIIGIMILLLVFVLIKSDGDDKTNNLKGLESNLDLESVDAYTKSCIELLTKEGIAKVGHEEINLLENYINDNLLECVNESNEIFLDKNISLSEVKTSIKHTKNNESLLVSVNFPLVVEKNGMLFSLETFESETPIKLKQELEIIDNILQKTVIITTPDSRLKMKIEEGTKITNKYGHNFDEIWIDIKDKKDYYIYDDNSIFNIVYEMLPNGAQFNPPITVTLNYDDELVSNFDESKLTYSWYGAGKWTPYPSTVDTVNNVITAQVDHFTGGSGTEGGSDDPEPIVKDTCGTLSQNECGAVGSVDHAGAIQEHCIWEDSECKPSCGVWLTDNNYAHGEGLGCINGGVPGFSSISCTEENSTCEVGLEIMNYLGLNISNNTAPFTMRGTNTQVYAPQPTYGCEFCLEQGYSGSGVDELDLNSVIWSGSDVSGLPIVSPLEVKKIDVGEAGMEYVQSMLKDVEMGLIYFFWESGGQWYGKSIEHIGAERPWNVARGLHYIGEKADPGPIPSSWKVCPRSSWGNDGGFQDAAVPPVGEEVYYLVVNENPEKQERTAVKSFTVYVENKCGTPVEEPVDPVEEKDIIPSLNDLIFQINENTMHKADLRFPFLDLFYIKYENNSELDFNISLIKYENPNCNINLDFISDKNIQLSKNDEETIEFWYNSEENIDPYCIFEGEILFQNNKNSSDTLTKTFKINFTDSQSHLEDIKFNNENQKKMSFSEGFTGELGTISLHNDGPYTLNFKAILSESNTDECKLNLKISDKEYTVEPDENFIVKINVTPEANQICTLKTDLSFKLDGYGPDYEIEIISKE